MSSRFIQHMKSHAKDISLSAQLIYFNTAGIVCIVGGVIGGFTGLHYSLKENNQNAKYLPFMILGGATTGVLIGITYPLFLPWSVYKYVSVIRTEVFTNNAK